jgi:predicted ribosome quality control (RQC) complex YloA/Tae2 family protein
MKTIKTIVLTAIGMYVLYLVFSGPCNESNESVIVNDVVQKGDKELRDSLQSYFKQNGELTKEVQNLTSVIALLKKNEQVLRKDSDKSKSVALQLRNELREFRLMDTADSYRKIDSLLVETESLAYLLDQYIVAYESLSDAVEKRDSVKDALLEQRAQLISQMTTQYDLVHSGFNKVFSDNQGLKRSLKREKLKTKIAAVLAVAAGILTAIK